MKTYRVGIIGATGMVGQRFMLLLEKHPWFRVTVLAASGRSAGKPYAEAVDGRWMMQTPIPASYQAMQVYDAAADFDRIVEQVDLVFCAVNMKKEDVKALEERYAKAECPVISNNSAYRSLPDVPMLIPELNPEHLQAIPLQRKRLGTRRGFIMVKPNCSLQTYVPALHPLREFGVSKVLACTYQAISGAGKTFARWPEMIDNVIPYIGDEEMKSEQEPLKIWGKLTDEGIQPAAAPVITTQCIRVPVTDGHMAATFVTFDRKPSMDEIKARWTAFSGRPQALQLPSAPKQLLHVFAENDRPQTALDRGLENGMAVSIGRLRPDTLFDYKFVCMSHNTLRGAAGGGVLAAELAAAEGYLD